MASAIYLEIYQTRHEKRRDWETSLWLKKESCPSRLTYCCGPPSGLVVMLKIFSAKLACNLKAPFFAASSQLRMWGRKQQEFSELRQQKSWQMNQLWTETHLYLAFFDSDSFCIDIDTLCTWTLSGNKNHFQDLQLYNWKRVTCIAGRLEIAGEGMFVFQIEDNNCQIDTIKILKLPLLFPQHWAERVKDNHPIKYEMKIEADEDGCTLLWQQQTR